jgi:hypothetical protein
VCVRVCVCVESPCTVLRRDTCIYGLTLVLQLFTGRIVEADILLATPEKVDVLTRRWKDHTSLIGQIGLLLIDEVHLVGEPRGSTLEAVITRMKTVSGSEEVRAKDWPAKNMRALALSATLPNVVDFGEWLECPPRSVLFFGEVRVLFHSSTLLLLTHYTGNASSAFDYACVWVSC